MEAGQFFPHQRRAVAWKSIEIIQPIDVCLTCLSFVKDGSVQVLLRSLNVSLCAFNLRTAFRQTLAACSLLLRRKPQHFVKGQKACIARHELSASLTGLLLSHARM